MRWPIRNQIFLPFAALLAITVSLIAVTSSYLAAKRYRETQNLQLARVLDTLGSADFPYTDSVLQKMLGLSGAEFIVHDSSGTVTATTLESAEKLTGEMQIPILRGDSGEFGEFAVIELDGESYLAASIPLTNTRSPGTLYVLYSRSEFSQAQWAAMWPPLAIGGGTLLLMLLASAWLADRFGRRISTVQDMFAKIADGQFPSIPTPQLDDELRALLASANELSSQLESLQNEIRRTERFRLLAQLAGGFAHQLRNAVTGARLALELHGRECRQPDNENLRVALMQLQLTEKQIQGLLSLGRSDHSARTPVTITHLLERVESLVSPQIVHRSVALEVNSSVPPEITVADGEAMEGTLLNLTLNAIEATGTQGQVAISAMQSNNQITIDIRDNGPGLSQEIAEKAFAPFESTKPEGVGLGLTMAQQTAQSLGGQIQFLRKDGWTIFRMTVPAIDETSEVPVPSDTVGSAD